ncbi:MAG TPA: serine/threonine-protein kinase [Kofleriaceae bacterium]|jgi:serine/threonine-protein kinase|nr:serine/threonine-protein kinase [Kofleriaceae bacterium]
MPSATTLMLGPKLPPPIPPQLARPSRHDREATRDEHAGRRRTRMRRATLAPGMRIGPWRIERELGRGGMATVYAAVHTRFGKRAALKLAHRGALGEMFTPRDEANAYLREARIANLIEHPGVTEVFATGTYDGRPYLVMERLTGQTLDARMDAGPMPHDEALEILRELCDVLAASHAAGVTHRDLKLDNVFLLHRPDSSGQRLKLLDWGMARLAGEDDPLRGLIAGTLTYVAPEQVRGDDITPAADLYALAVLAYQLLLGRPPFTSPNDLELLDKHLRDEPPAPHTLWPEIPAELDAVLVAMLAKQPADRPALARVAHALAAARGQAAAPSPTVVIRRRWMATSVAAPADLLGRTLLPWFATPRHRTVSAALGIMLTLASVLVIGL